MAPLKIALVGVLGIGIAASLAFADHQPNHPGGGDTGGVTGTWVFAGYTSDTTITGSATRPAMYASCQIDFGLNARMALVEEWVKSPNITLPGTTGAWLQPVLNTNSPVDDAYVSNNNSDCSGWAGGLSGMHVSVNGQIRTEDCNIGRAVACVVPQ